MSTHDPPPSSPGPLEAELGDPLTRELELGFAPLHKRALGLAVGLVFGLCLFAVTAVAIVRGDTPDFLMRLPFLVPLYDISWTGAILGSLSAGFAFFCAGWFLAFCRNLVLAVSIWVLRTRVELGQTRDFLDHI